MRERIHKCDKRGLYDYLKESKEDMLSGALKENVIEDRETKEEFTKRKKDESKKTLRKGKLQAQFVDETRNIAQQIQSKQRYTNNHFLPSVDCVEKRTRQFCI